MSQTSPFRLNLAHLAWSLVICAACASDHLPLEVDTEATRGTPELAGSSGVLPPTAAGAGAGSFAGSAGSSAGWAGSSPGKSPLPRPPREAVCGDNVVEPQEACDRTNLNGATCRSLGFNGGGVLLCNPTTCLYDTIMCRMTRRLRSTPASCRPIGVPSTTPGTDDPPFARHACRNQIRLSNEQFVARNALA